MAIKNLNKWLNLAIRYQRSDYFAIQILSAGSQLVRERESK